MSTLDERMERLERECRWWRRAGLATAIAGVVVLAAGNGKPAEEAKTIETERLILRDKQGKKRIELAVDADGEATIALSDREGRLRAGLGVGPSGDPELVLKASGDNPSISLGLWPDEQMPYLQFYGNDSDKPRLNLQLGADGSVNQSLFGKDGKERVGVYITPDGQPQLNLRSDADELIFHAP